VFERLRWQSTMNSAERGPLAQMGKDLIYNIINEDSWKSKQERLRAHLELIRGIRASRPPGT
jgi:hypothetical protein